MPERKEATDVRVNGINEQFLRLGDEIFRFTVNSIVLIKSPVFPCSADDLRRKVYEAMTKEYVHNEL